MSEMIIWVLHTDINMIPDTVQRIQRNVYQMYIRMQNLHTAWATLCQSTPLTQYVFENHQVAIYKDIISTLRRTCAYNRIFIIEQTNTTIEKYTGCKPKSCVVTQTSPESLKTMYRSLLLRIDVLRLTSVIVHFPKK